MEETITVEDSCPQIEEVTTSEAWKSDKIDKLASALAKTQGELDGAAKKSTNPFFKSGYADLHEVISSTFPHLSKNGLSVSLAGINSL